MYHKIGKSSQATLNSSSSNSSSENSADGMSELEEEDLDLIKNNLNLNDLEEVGIATKVKIIFLRSRDYHTKQKFLSIQGVFSIMYIQNANATNF